MRIGDARLSGAWLFARSRGVARLLVVLVIVVASLAAPRGLTSVPLRDYAATSLLPLIAALPGMLVAACLTAPHPELEKVGVRSMPAVRAAWLGVVFMSTAVLLLVFLGDGLRTDFFMLRNHLLSLGVTAAAAVVLPPAASWVPMGVVIAVNGIYGTVDVAGTPQPWALLQMSWDAPVAGLAAVTIGILGPALWIWRDGI